MGLQPAHTCSSSSLAELGGDCIQEVTTNVHGSLFCFADLLLHFCTGRLLQMVQLNYLGARVLFSWGVLEGEGGGEGLHSAH